MAKFLRKQRGGGNYIISKYQNCVKIILRVKKRRDFSFVSYLLNNFISKKVSKLRQDNFACKAKKRFSFVSYLLNNFISKEVSKLRREIPAKIKRRQ